MKEGFGKFKAAILGTVALTGVAKTELAKAGDITGKETIGDVRTSPVDSSMEKESPFELWISAKTEAGAITPTGLDNSFLNNEYGVTAGDIGTIAKEHGFRTGTALKFQTDLFSYLEKNHPEIIDYLLKKYGQTAAGTLDDGLLGARTAEAMHELLKKVPDGGLKQQVELKQPNTNYVINVRGDQESYYFPQSGDAWAKLSDHLPFSSKEESEGGAKGQTTVNMTQKTLDEYYATTPEIKKLLGPKYHRDLKDPTKFIPESNTVNFLDYAGK